MEPACNVFVRHVIALEVVLPLDVRQAVAGQPSMVHVLPDSTRPTLLSAGSTTFSITIYINYCNDVFAAQV